MPAVVPILEVLAVLLVVMTRRGGGDRPLT
jgi:hypothetical protein